jgi:hypothetical protein
VKDLDELDPTLKETYDPPRVCQNDVGVTTDKHIVVPSMGAITDIFKSHLGTLKVLR